MKEIFIAIVDGFIVMGAITIIIGFCFLILIAMIGAFGLSIAYLTRISAILILAYFIGSMKV